MALLPVSGVLETSCSHVLEERIQAVIAALRPVPAQPRPLGYYFEVAA